MSEVYLNGKFVGTIENAEDFIKQVRAERRRGVITTNLNIRNDTALDQVRIDISRGRARRPLIVVKGGISQLTEKHIKDLQKNEIRWGDLIEQGVIEYLDASEEEDALVAMAEDDLNEDYTHLEITPLAMLGLVTSLVPFGNYNQSTRLNAGSKNQKQAVGFYTSNYHVRMDMDVNILHTPQIPLVKTIMHDISQYQDQFEPYLITWFAS